MEGDFIKDINYMKNKARYDVMFDQGKKAAHPCLVKYNPEWVQDLEYQKKGRMGQASWSNMPNIDWDNEKKSGDFPLLEKYRALAIEALYTWNWDWPIPECVSEWPDKADDYTHSSNMIGRFHFVFVVNCGCLFLWNLVNLVLSGATDFRNGKYLVFTWTLENHVSYKILAYFLAAQPFLMLMSGLGWMVKEDIEDGELRKVPDYITSHIFPNFSTIFMTMFCGCGLLVVNRHAAKYANMREDFTKLKFKRNFFQMLFQTNDVFELVIAHACMLAKSESKESQGTNYKQIKEILDGTDDELEEIATKVMAAQKDLEKGNVGKMEAESEVADANAADLQEAADQVKGTCMGGALATAAAICPGLQGYQ